MLYLVDLYIVFTLYFSDYLLSFTHRLSTYKLYRNCSAEQLAPSAHLDFRKPWAAWLRRFSQPGANDFEARHLRVRERDGDLQLDLLPLSVRGPCLRDTIHWRRGIRNSAVVTPRKSRSRQHRRIFHDPDIALRSAPCNSHSSQERHQLRDRHYEIVVGDFDAKAAVLFPYDDTGKFADLVELDFYRVTFDAGMGATDAEVPVRTIDDCDPGGVPSLAAAPSRPIYLVPVLRSPFCPHIGKPPSSCHSGRVCAN
ncbi:MAG: hypothetical protein ACREPG_02735 [Candidatus Binatia bacterium]